MFIFLAVLISIISIFVIAITIVQNSKKDEGNNLDGMGAHILMGVKQTNDFLVGTTWILFSILVLLSFLINRSVKGKKNIISPNLEYVKQHALPKEENEKPQEIVNNEKEESKEAVEN